MDDGWGWGTRTERWNKFPQKADKTQKARIERDCPSVWKQKPSDNNEYEPHAHCHCPHSHMHTYIHLPRVDNHHCHHPTPHVCKLNSNSISPHSTPPHVSHSIPSSQLSIWRGFTFFYFFNNLYCPTYLIWLFINCKMRNYNIRA